MSFALVVVSSAVGGAGLAVFVAVVLLKKAWDAALERNGL